VNVFGENQCETRPIDRDLQRDLINEATEKVNVARGGCDSPKRWTLRDRIENAILEGKRADRRASAAHRAKYILDQHPEFGELLDLMHEF
jgi:hypothetical protein